MYTSTSTVKLYSDYIHPPINVAKIRSAHIREIPLIIGVFAIILNNAFPVFQTSTN